MSRELWIYIVTSRMVVFQILFVFRPPVSTVDSYLSHLDIVSSHVLNTWAPSSAVELANLKEN